MTSVIPHPTASLASTVRLRTAANFWLIWGLVHILAGALTLSGDAAYGAQGIADAVDPQLLQMNYHGAVQELTCAMHA